MGPTLASSADFHPTRQGYVYALVSSDEPERIRYVGSTWEPRPRLFAHITKPSNAVGKWAQQIIQRGGVILMRQLAVGIDRQGLYDLEAEHIRRLWAIGQSDLNAYAGDGEKRPGSTARRDRRIRT